MPADARTESMRTPAAGIEGHAEVVVAPTGRGPWGPWSTLLISFGIVAVGYLLAPIGCVVMIQAGLGGTAFADLVTDEVLLFNVGTGAAGVVVLALVGAAVLARGGPPLLDYLALRPVRVRGLLPWLGAVMLLMIGYDALCLAAGISPYPEHWLALFRLQSWPLSLLLVFVVVAPLTEEILFRGFVLSGLESLRGGTFVPVAVSAVLWTLLHVGGDGHSGELVYVFGLGLLLGYARLAADSVLMPLGVHAINNLAAWFSLTGLVRLLPVS